MHELDEFKALSLQAEKFSQSEYHLKNLIREPDRFQRFSLGADSMFFDFSRQRIDGESLASLHALAEKTRALETFSQMTLGSLVNKTEQRAALHTGAREFSRKELRTKEVDVLGEMARVNQEIQDFSSSLHAGRIKGSTGKPFTHAVIVGIGGSYLGCEFVYEALKTVHDPKIRLSFLSNVDIDNFGTITKEIDPETCLWIVISKSYTTTETMANLEQVQTFLKDHDLNVSGHLVTITAKASPGDDPSAAILDSFHMFDFIGGRYSVSSAVGGLPLSLAFGFGVFEDFLQGCHLMDLHAQRKAPEENIPLTAALISIWNIFCLGYPAQAVIPYSSGLSRLAPHVQQLYMESLGKMVTEEGQFLNQPGGCIIFGEPGTNAQHSFFQLAHQGPAFPIDFIGVVTPGFTGRAALSKGVSNHQELWANMIAQTTALALGKEDERPEKFFPGNRPSSVILINDLSARSIGTLLSFYEARTVLEGFILGINPFDQFGVELGKTLATSIRTEIQSKNNDPSHGFDHMGRAEEFYLTTLFKGKL